VLENRGVGVQIIAMEPSDRARLFALVESLLAA